MRGFPLVSGGFPLTEVSHPDEMKVDLVALCFEDVMCLICSWSNNVIIMINNNSLSRSCLLQSGTNEEFCAVYVHS